MRTIDGWVNVSRVGDDDPVRKPNAGWKRTAQFFGEDADRWFASALSDLTAAMDACAVDQGLLTVSNDRVGKSTAGGITLEQGLAIAAETPDRFRLVYQVARIDRPTRSMDRIEELAANPAVAAAALFPATLGCDILDRRLYPLYAACSRTGLPVRINVGICGPRYPSRHQHPMQLEELLIDFPELTVIGAHMGHPWEAELIRLMMKFERLHLMTSAYLARYFDPALVDFMSSSRGRGRVFFASDAPFLPMKRATEDARKLPLDDDSMAEFLGAGLARVLGWQSDKEER